MKLPFAGFGGDKTTLTAPAWPHTLASHAKPPTCQLNFFSRDLVIVTI